MKRLAVAALLALGGCATQVTAPGASGSGGTPTATPAPVDEPSYRSPYPAGADLDSLEVIRNGDLVNEVSVLMHEIARSEGDLVSVAVDQLRRTLTAYWHDEPPAAARRLAGTTSTGVDVVVRSVPFPTRAKHDAAERIFAAAAAGRTPRLQIVRWNAAFDGIEVGFASPEFEQVAADEDIRRLLAELAGLPAVVVRHSRIRSV